MKGRNPTAEERRHMARVRDIGCIACINMGLIIAYEMPAEQTLIHHVYGKTVPNAHKKTLPLCDPHHSPHYHTGLHSNRVEWEVQHGTQRELLEQVEGML